MKKILTINPGSTSTKIGIFGDEELLFEETLRHSAEEIDKYDTIFDQLDFRKEIILNALKKANVEVKELAAIVGRGGMFKPIAGGTYAVNDLMISDMKAAKRGEHASNLGCVIAKTIADTVGIPSFIVDPVAVDEMEDIARITGMPEIKRESLFHALNQKAIARQYAKDQGKKYEDMDLIVVHLGGGISVGAHKKGRVIDVNEALAGDGPMSPERSGDIPAGPLYQLAYSGKYTLAEMKKMNFGKGGLVAHLGTNDGREVLAMIEKGDKKAALVFEAMAYQVAKEIGKMATVLKGSMEAILITGGLAYSKVLTDWITERVEFMSKVVIIPGEDELKALALGGLRVVNGEEKAQEYK